MYINNPENIDTSASPCIPQETVLRDVQLAASYVPFQFFCGVMPPLESLSKGTAFYELYSPYQKREFSNLESEKEPCQGRGNQCDE